MRISAHILLPPILAACSIACARPANAERAPSKDPPQVFQLAGRTMGTTYHLKFWGNAAATPVDVHNKIESLLEQFDKQMSTYRDDSELSRFNAADGHEWFPVSADTAHVVAKAIEFHKLTGGALDVTVAPLSRLWTFDAAGKRKGQPAAPSVEQIDQALRLVGVKHLKVRREPPALWKDQAEVEIDLSAIAPGYAVDLVLELLQSLGFANAMVEIGGEVHGIGLRPDGTPWLVGVERAGKPAANFIEIVPLKNLALTTAGDYRNLRTIDGREYTHIIDPRTGHALPHRGVAVTVLAETAMEADALDTALIVMGADDGYKWCVEHNVAALFQIGEAGSKVRRTPRFVELLREGEAPAEP
ncbi:MAG TPA: FAD:protein FMN transferase [Lacipirellula sp.]